MAALNKPCFCWPRCLHEKFAAFLQTGLYSPLTRIFKSCTKFHKSSCKFSNPSSNLAIRSLWERKYCPFKTWIVKLLTKYMLKFVLWNSYQRRKQINQPFEMEFSHIDKHQVEIILVVPCCYMSSNLVLTNGFITKSSMQPRLEGN